jgi:5-methylcytosine-specific restriction endonuclease McrA
MESIPVKTCTKCGTEFPATTEYFVKQKAGKYGVTSQCKACTAAYHAALYKADPRIRERNLARHRKQASLKPKQARVLKTPEQKAATAKAWRAKTAEIKAAEKPVLTPAEQLLITEAAMQRRNTRVTAYRAANTENHKIYRRIWLQNNPERRAAYRRNRRARKSAATGSHTAEDVKQQLKSQKGKCYWCGKKLKKYHIDHRIALAKGGSNGPENIVCACAACNLSKGAKTPWDFAGRLL